MMRLALADVPAGASMMAGLPAGARVVVGMSGGVDSAVAAGLVAEAGFETVGVTLQLYDQGAASGRKGACCAGQDIEDAARAAERLGIAHYVLDYERRFREAVIDPFVAGYAQGMTPIPCIACNETVKFTDLLAVAGDLGAAALVTGHYAQRLAGAAGPELHRAADPARDQSYFLCRTTPAQLDRLRFPLGAFTKDETRRAAARLGLDLAAKPDSQDICFVPDGDHAALLRRLDPASMRPGDIVGLDGAVLGRHDGIGQFTVGQRKGLGVGGMAEPLYVVRIDADAARVVVGPRAALGRRTVRLHAVNWLDPTAAMAADRPVAVKLRSAQAPLPARLDATGPETARLTLATETLTGIAPGQAAALYDGTRLIAGGWIARDEPGNDRPGDIAPSSPLR